MIRSKTIRVAAIAALVLMVTADAQAGGRRWGRRGRAACGAAMQPAMAYRPQMATRATVATSATPMDAGSFVAWVNRVRNAAGQPGVGWDDNLAAWAQENSRRGFGHSVLVGRGQNSGIGEFSAVCAGWLQSGPHLAAIVDPSVTRVGLGCVGMIWTANFD